MYIRRKVFTKLQDETGEERYFSTTEFTVTKDTEGLKYFSECCDDSKEEDKSKKKKGLGKKIAAGTGIAAGTTLAAAKGYQLLKGNKYKKDRYLQISKLDEFGHNIEDNVKNNVDKIKQHLKRKK